MQQHILDFEKRINFGEVVFEIDKEFFVTKKIYLINKNNVKEYLVKVEYSLNGSMRPIRENIDSFTNFQQAYDCYVNINTTHNLYTKVGKAKIEEDKAKQPKILFENESVQMVDINSIIIPETGKNYRQTNLQKVHTVSLGSLVELETGVRLFVVEHVRDFDGTPLYNLCHDKDWEEGEDIQLGNSTIPGKTLSRRALSQHHPLEGLILIKSAEMAEEEL
jgi:hypothetical protein